MNNQFCLSQKSLRRGGFTLIEVMITVAIISILAAVALPAYGTYVMRGRIPDAVSGLASEQVQMEQYFQDNKKYDTTAPGCASASSKYFTFTCAATATTYTLKATGTGPMAGFVYTVTESNSKASTVDTTVAPAGWTGSTTCWITRKGGVC